MAEGPNLAREGTIQPILTDSSFVNKDFWTRLDEVERLLDEARLLLEELKEARAFNGSS